ncbi:hypothetical protein ABZX51_005437 [Aspergillus tubingensis]
MRSHVIITWFATRHKEGRDGIWILFQPPHCVLLLGYRRGAAVMPTHPPLVSRLFHWRASLCGTNYGTQTTRCHCKLSSVAFVMVKQSSLPNVPTCVDLAYSPSFDGYLELNINVQEVSMVGIAT